MKRIKQTLLGVAMCLTISSCGTMISDSVMKVRKGMSQDEVIHALGTPDYRRFTDSMEQWEYHKQNLTGSEKSIIIIDFANGEVVNMDSFSKILPKPPVIAYSPAAEVISLEASAPQRRHRHQGQILPRRRAMQAQDFDNLYDKIKKKPFKDDRMELLSVSAINNYFSCNQCALLMSVFTWDDDKIKVLQMLCDRLVDKENGEVIVKSFTSLFKQDDARKILEF